MEWFVISTLTVTSYLFYVLPRPLQLAFGNLLGIIFERLKFKSKVVDRNLEIAFPLDAEKKKRIRRQSYRAFGNLILEVLLLFGPLKRFIFKNVDFSGRENWERAHAQGKGVIVLSSHVGNWEVMAATGTLIGKIDLMLVTKHLKPEWFHRAIEKRRLRCGVRATYEPKTSRDIIKHLKSNGTVGFVLDQYAGAPVGVRVPLFGTPVGTSTAVAVFAKRTGAPVIPVINFRRPDGRWTVKMLPELKWNSENVASPQQHSSHFELASNTARYAAELEGHILEHPEQWLWIHNRFKGDLSPIKAGEWAAPRDRT
ncbi:MAG: lysophospholipid acyltransferase family protein [Bdellovibrio sp.]|nr:lysophospholipid acyltransferase family protein [Bdellovibrio sp.]